MGTKNEVFELIRACRNDPVLFAEKMLDLELHDGQRLWLWMSSLALVDPEAKPALIDKAVDLGTRLGHWKSRQEWDALFGGAKFLKNILVPSNRWGKTFSESVKHIWINRFKLGVRGGPEEIAMTQCGTLNLSPHSKQCGAGFDYVVSICWGRHTWIGRDGKPRRNGKCLLTDFIVGKPSKYQRIITFSNGTTYQAVPTGDDQASSIAGTRYLFISYDECAQSLHLKSELPAKIMSRLIDFGGPIDLLSTPEVDRPSHQYFFGISRAGLEGRDGWFTLVGKIFDNPFLPQEETASLLEEIRRVDPAKYRQVAFGEFVTTGSKMFDSLAVERVFDPNLSSGIPEEGSRYVVGADWGFSDTGDPTVFYVVKHWKKEVDGSGPNYYRIVHREAIRGGSPFAVMSRAKFLQREWLGAVFVHDSAAMGGTMIAKSLREMGMRDVVDFNAAGGNKADLLFALQVVLTANRRQKAGDNGARDEINMDFGRLRSFDIPELEDQLGNYQYNPSKGIYDRKLEQDEVMALGMVLWYLEGKSGRRGAKTIGINPLAGTVDEIFSGSDRTSIKVRSVKFKERIIN